MDLRTWLVETLTGDVVTRIHMTDRSQFTSVIGGGQMRGEISLAKLRNLDGSRSISASRQVLQSLENGMHTILVTSGNSVIGEWVIWRFTREHGASTIPVTGFEWDDYPQYRSIHTTFKHTATDAGVLHRAALIDSYGMFQPGDAEIVQVPAVSFGQAVEMNKPMRSGYYSDIVRDLDALGLAEWRVVPSVTWGGGVPVKVTRTVRYQQPILSSPHPDPLVKPGDGARGGNVTAFSRAYDFDRKQGAVVAVGAGKGGKQRLSLKRMGDYISRGHIANTRHIRFSEEYSQEVLGQKAQHLLDSSQDPWEPAQATVDARRLSTLPVIGGVHDVSVGPTWMYPEGGSWQMRVGQATYRYGSPLVDVEMEEI